MTLSVDAIWEYHANGTPTAGGGFVPGGGGVDRSQQPSVHATRTDIVIDGADSTKTTSAGDPYVADDVGNIENNTSGTGFTAGRFELLSVAAGVATWDRSRGTISSTGGNAVLGGAMTILSANFEMWTTGNKGWIKQDGTHTLTAGVTVFKDGIATLPMTIEGYKTTRGDALASSGVVEANRPLIATGGNTFTFDNFWRFKYLEITTTSSNGLAADNSLIVTGCKINNSSGSGSRACVTSSGAGKAIIQSCELQSVNGEGYDSHNVCTVISTNFHDSTTGIFHDRADCTYINCIFDTCTIGLDISNNGDSRLINCTFYNCTDGIKIALSKPGWYFSNLIIDSCTTGINQLTAENVSSTYISINLTNNGTDLINVNNIINQTSVDPGFTDAANGDFTTTSGMQIAEPQTFPGGLFATNKALGVAQLAGGGGGGVTGYVGYIG